LQSSLVIDRDTASRLGVNMTDIDNTLGDASASGRSPTFTKVLTSITLS